MLNTIIAKFETEKHGCLVSIEDSKEFIMRNSSEFPITHGKVKEFNKMVGKEFLKMLRNDNGNNTMLTLYGYDSFFNVENVCRFTFDVWNGEINVQYRMHIENEGFPIAVETIFDSSTKAKNYVINLMNSHIHELIEIKDNSENYFTKNMK